MNPLLPYGLLNVAAADFGLQFLAWTFAAYFQTEKFYDFTGSVTYWMCILLSIRQSVSQELSVRQLVNAALVLVWSARLGTFLLYRAIRDGGDSRFNEVRSDPYWFLIYWLIQGGWCFITAFPVYKLLLQNDSEELGLRDYCGWALWLLGFVVQAISDMQKLAFKSNPENKGKFINSGLWFYSQHPNYAGEILMWAKIFLSITSAFSLTECFLTSLSPICVYYLLCFVSGIPLLDRAAQKKHGADTAFQAYFHNTPVLFPCPKLRKFSKIN